MSVKEPKRVAKAEVSRVFDQGIVQNDQVRMQGLSKLSALRTSKAKLQSREEHRLANKYDANHPRTLNARAKLDTNADFISGLKMESRRATTKVEKPDARTWVVQGRVYDRRGCPAPNTQVAVYHSSGQRVESIPAVATDSKGYYKITHTTTATPGTVGGGDTAGGAPASGISTNVDAADSGDGGGERLGEGLRINRAAGVEQAVFLRAQSPDNEAVCADSTLITPRPGQCNYRDIILNIDRSQQYASDLDKDRRSSRFLGNSATRELHDLKNEKSGCQIDEIRIDRCVRFKSIEEAQALGYDFCAYCFGRELSQR